MPLIVIGGPTATGKSALAVYLAKLFDTEIISADSMQIYKGLDIGTAKPSKEDMNAIPHHMIDIVDPDVRFSTGEYVSLARPIIEGLHGRRKIPVVAGGTGLYIRALIDGLCEAPKADWRVRKRLLSAEEKHGRGYLYRRLRDVDPLSAERIEPNDTSKIIRALEVYETAGIPLSSIQEIHGFKERRYDPLIFIGITLERKNLYKRIEERVDRMIEAGLEVEVRRLVDSGGGSLPAMQGLGYKQLAGYVRGEYSFDEAVRLFKRDTKRYAKRQLTWFRREERMRWYTVKEDMSHFEEIAGDIGNKISNFKFKISNVKNRI